MLALLGPNGAGKTTMVRVLFTLTPPDSGSATIAGHDLLADPIGVKRAISLTGQFAAVDEVLTGRENLDLMARLRRFSAKAARARTAQLLESFDLTEAADRRAGTYSGGMKRRLDLAIGMIERPAVLVGHVVASLVRNLVATTLVVCVGLAIGWRPTASPLDWLAAVGMTVLFMLAISWLAAAAGLLARTAEAATPFTMVLMFIPYVSTAFVPAESMPTVVARYQPFTPIIETMRGLWMGSTSTGTSLGGEATTAVLYCVVILAFSAVAAARLFRERSGG